MNKEKYIARDSIDHQSELMIVEKVLESDDGLSILLRHSGSADKPNQASNKLKLEILFDSFVAYRNMDESYRARTIDEYPEGMKNTYYTVINSSWIEWLNEESKGIYADRDVKHYSIITIADWIDVLSEFPPSFRWIRDD